MSDSQGTFPWTDEQWTRARKVVQDSARRARVASSFLPLFGPLPADQATVNSQHMSSRRRSSEGPYDAEERLEVNDTTTVALTTISADVYLRTYEAADPEMTAALAMIARAADVLGRLEDSLIFNGQPGESEGPAAPAVPVEPPIYRIKGGEERPGLLTVGDEPIEVSGDSEGERGAQLVRATVDAIEQLEANGHYGPFAQVLGTELYLAANTPNHNSMVLPSDRIRPFLDGPLLRSSTIPRDAGVVVALAGEPVDLVIAHDLELKLVQMTLEPRYVLRLSERFTLRIKQEGAVVRLEATG